MLKRIVAITTVLSLCLIFIILNTSVPTSIGPFGILSVFILAYLSSLGVVTYFLYAVSRLISHLSSAFTVKKPIGAINFRKSYYYSTVIAAAPILLIGLQSVGSIGAYEVILVMVFVIIGCIYITKRIQ